jgi:hypothetical protein
MQPSTDSFIKSFKQCANAWIRQRRAEFGNDIEARYGWKKVLLSYFVFYFIIVHSYHQNYCIISS